MKSHLTKTVAAVYDRRINNGNSKTYFSALLAVQNVRITPFREEFYHPDSESGDDTDGANAECSPRETWQGMQNEEFLSVKSVKSVVKFLSLRLCCACVLCA